MPEKKKKTQKIPHQNKTNKPTNHREMEQMRKFSSKAEMCEKEPER